MAGLAKVGSIREAKEIFARLAPDMTIRSKEGEYRVTNGKLNDPERREACAYYTTDLTDAVTTGLVMYEKGAW